jgi:hypothetical protein
MKYGNQRNGSEMSMHTSSSSGFSYLAGAPLRSVHFDPSNAGVIEEQQQQNLTPPKTTSGVQSHQV